MYIRNGKDQNLEKSCTAFTTYYVTSPNGYIQPHSSSGLVLVLNEPQVEKKLSFLRALWNLESGTPTLLPTRRDLLKVKRCLSHFLNSNAQCNVWLISKNILAK